MNLVFSMSNSLTESSRRSIS